MAVGVAPAPPAPTPRSRSKTVSPGTYLACPSPPACAVGRRSVRHNDRPPGPRRTPFPLPSLCSALQHPQSARYCCTSVVLDGAVREQSGVFRGGLPRGRTLARTLARAQLCRLGSAPTETDQQPSSRDTAVSTAMDWAAYSEAQGQDTTMMVMAEPDDRGPFTFLSLDPASQLQIARNLYSPRNLAALACCCTHTRDLVALRELWSQSLGLTTGVVGRL
jgi:hypothetical protein